MHSTIFVLNDNPISKTVIEDHMLGVNQSAILRWLRGIRYAARRRLDTTLVMQ